MKLSDYVMQFLVRNGVDQLFVLAGGACMHLVDSAGRTPGLEYVCCLHEQACAFAAEAYAEYRMDLGAALVTAGPGGTNAITGVAAAWLESASCIFLSGQAKRADLLRNRGVRSMGQQELDIISVVRPITKYAVQVLDPNAIRYELEKAVWLAKHGRRGPVWLDIPLDVQAADIKESALTSFEPDPVVPALLQREVLAAVDLWNRSERPVLFLGNGIRAAHNHGLLNRLIDLLQAPVLLTWKAVDIVPEDHPFYIGRPGAIGQRAANFTQQNADCIMILGARLDLPQTAFSHTNFARAATKVMVDIDPAELAKMETPIDLAVCADASDFIGEVLRHAQLVAFRDRSDWCGRAKAWKQKYPVVLPEYWNQPLVNTYVFIDVLSEELNKDDLLVPGSSGPCSDIFMQAFRVKLGQRVVNAPGLGAMGTGLPGTIGACLAGGGRRTVCINGDGGFQLNIQELETVRRLNLPIKFFVLCNGGYASIMTSQRIHFGRLVASDPSSQLTLPDIQKVAAAYGLRTSQIDSHEHLREQIRNVLDTPGPIVCAVTTSPDQATAPRVTSTVQPDGSIMSHPMEDMWPFLSREELSSNMIPSRKLKENTIS